MTTFGRKVATLVLSGPPRPDMWHRRFAPALALGLVVLPFAAVLLWAATTSQAVDQEEIAAAIRSTAGTVSEHAAVMSRIGERLATAAAGSTAPDAPRWMAYGQHLMSDATGLAALRGRLEAGALLADNDQIHRGRPDLFGAVLEASWEQLRSDGRATSLHGTLMAEQARAMAAVPHSGIATDGDLRELEQASIGMQEAGDRTVRIAEQLLASVSQMRRWLER